MTDVLFELDSLASVAGRSIVLLGLTFGAAIVCRGRSAAVVHGIWAFGLGSCLAIPFASWLVPQWGLTLLPSRPDAAANSPVTAVRSTAVRHSDMAAQPYSSDARPVAIGRSTTATPPLAHRPPTRPSAELSTGSLAAPAADGRFDGPSTATMNTSQKFAVITGASQGIGAGLVRGFLDRGYQVVANSRSIQAEKSSNVMAVAGDIADQELAKRVIRTAVAQFGRVDTLVNIARIDVLAQMPFRCASRSDVKRSNGSDWSAGRSTS